MIELPDFATMGNATPSLMDMGFTQRGISTSSRIDRKGSRYGLACSYGPFTPEKGRVMVSRLIAAKQEGVRVPLPLLHDQGSPGSPVVDGAAQTGKTLTIRNLTPGYFCKEGFWLSIESNGQHFLHNVRTGGRANGAGELTITLNEMLRASFDDGASVHLAKPMVEGLIDGDEWQWNLSVDQAIPINFTLGEKQ